MISIHRYSGECTKIWNNFNAYSLSNMFMFNRNYMDYHKDRFSDHSLLFYSDNDIVCLLPACEINNSLISHAGLTFGGMIVNHKMKQPLMNSCFKELIHYLRDNGMSSLTYKRVPGIYSSQISEADKYSLYCVGAQLSVVDVSTCINLLNPLKMSKGRKAQISRAKREGIYVEEVNDLNDYREFIRIENEILLEKHHVKATHTGEELKMLHDRFPNNIHLFATMRNDSMIGGVVVYEYDKTIHTQYMASNEESRYFGGLDATIDYIISKYSSSKTWLDFGISTEHGRCFLNNGLVSQKEGFGGRTCVYETWNINVKSAKEENL